MYLGHGLRQSNSRTEFGRRSRCPKFFARIRPQNFDRCHSFLLASSATGGARKRPPLHKGAFRTGDADCRVASLLAMTVLNLCHSEEAQRADVGIRPFYDGRGFGPPYLGHGLRRPNFVPKFGASVKSSAPTESPINHPSQPARSEAPAPAAARNGRESALEPSKRDKLPRLPGQRLAKRKARKEQLVKFGFCPMTSECSTAHNVRKSQQSPARAPVGITSTEQDRLEPRPAARQGAPRP